MRVRIRRFDELRLRGQTRYHVGRTCTSKVVLMLGAQRNGRPKAAAVDEWLDENY